MKTRLFRIVFDIRPVLGHPNFSTLRDGVAIILIFAESTDKASNRAIAIMQQLPYELTSKAHEITHGDLGSSIAHPPEVDRIYRALIQDAWRYGIGLGFWFPDTGGQGALSEAPGPVQPPCRVPAPARQQ